MFNNVWPANIFANNRIAKLKGLIQNDNSSITAKNGTKNWGTPFGLNKSKNVLSLFNRPINTTAIKKVNDKESVNIIWPVIDIL